MDTIDLKNDVFNARQACEISGITRKQLIYWDRRGIVKPSVASASGRGSRRLYSYPDLLALKATADLRGGGMSLQKIRRCASYLRRHLPDMSRPLSFCKLVAYGETIILVKNKKALLDTVKRPGQMLLIDIANLDHELRNSVLQLRDKRVEEVVVGDFAFQVEIEPDTEEGGYSATIAGLTGCITDGETLAEVLENAEDAIECWLEAHEDLRRRGIEVPMTRPKRTKARA